MKGNVGEWSEVYAFYHALSQGVLVSADEHLRPLAAGELPIAAVWRSDDVDEPRFVMDHEGDGVRVVVGGAVAATVPRATFSRYRDNLLDVFRQRKARQLKGTFDVPEHEDFLRSLGCCKLKSGSCAKADIHMTLRDPRTGHSFDSGFSIKSQLGSPSTLLNAGKSTNLTFNLVPARTSAPQSSLFAPSEIDAGLGDGEEAPAKSRKIQSVFKEIAEQGLDVEFYAPDNPVFAANLELIDSRMSELVGYAVLLFYRDGVKSLSEVVGQLRQTNPLGFKNGNAYEYKFKKFLAAAALGMRPATQWDGNDEATGGYLLVTSSGEVLVYHTHDRARLEGYLLHHTVLETASTTRHEFGQIYGQQGQQRIKLNLQIRFNY